MSIKFEVSGKNSHQGEGIALITQNFDPAYNWMAKMQVSEIFTDILFRNFISKR